MKVLSQEDVPCNTVEDRYGQGEIEAAEINLEVGVICYRGEMDSVLNN